MYNIMLSTTYYYFVPEYIYNTIYLKKKCKPSIVLFPEYCPILVVSVLYITIIIIYCM